MPRRTFYRPSAPILVIIIGTVFLVLAAYGWWWLRSYLVLDGSQIEPGKLVIVNQLAPTSTPSASPNSRRRQPSPSPLDMSTDFRLEVVAENLEVPWRVVFTSPTRMLVTERAGRVRVVENGQLKPDPVATFQVSNNSEEGLMGLVLDPAYANNQLLYVCYAYEVGDELRDRVVRLQDKGDRLEVIGTILDNIPAAKYHAGCDLSFGPDGKLYISTGDATRKDQAQEKASLGGKILRVNSNGTIPTDNPVAGSPIYSLGHRNPQGLSWHPVTKQLWSTEHGPSGNDGPGGGDEVNAIVAGGNYGWPLVSHQRSQPGLISPLLVFTPAVAPASAHFYSGQVFPAWKNNLFFGALRGEGLFRVVVSESQPATVLSFEKLPNIDVGRVRAVTEGPDGVLYFTTSNRDGRGKVKDGDDKIYRLVRK